MIMDFMSAYSGLGGEVIEPPVSMPAALPLELSGESVRPRLCIFPGAFGKETALRADYTLPIAQIEAVRRKTGAADDKTYVYDGPVFRLPRDRSEAVEFRQVGFERYGFSEGAAVDSAALFAQLDALKSVGISTPSIRMGDLAIVPAFIDALDLPLETAKALKRAFRQAGGMTALLEKASNDTSSGLARLLSSLQEKDARTLLTETMGVSGITVIGTRSMDEVVERLIAQGRGAAIADISEGARKVLHDLISIDVPARSASEALLGLSQRHGLKIDGETLDAVSARVANIPATVSSRFTTTFGRQFTYYDGFVFDLYCGETIVGGGGRYDTLIAHLSNGAVSANAIGSALRVDRIEKALGVTQ